VIPSPEATGGRVPGRGGSPPRSAAPSPRSSRVAWCAAVSLAALLAGCALPGSGSGGGSSFVERRQAREAEALAERLDDVDTATCVRAASALARLGPRAAPVRSALVRALRDGAPEIRVAAARALASMGRRARAALPALERLGSRDPVAAVRVAASGAVARIARRPQRALRSLTAVLEHGPPRARAASADALGELAGAAACAVADLDRAARDDRDPAVRAAAALALARIGPERAPSVARLLEALADPDSCVRRRAADALAATGAGSERTIEALRARLLEDTSAVRHAAARALAAAGDRGKAVLRAGLEHSEPEVREAAVRGLATASPPPRAASGAVARLLADPSARVRGAAALTLARLGEPGDAARRLARQLAIDPELAELTGALVACGAHALRPLDEMLRHPRLDTARSAARILIAIEPRPETLPREGPASPRVALLRAWVRGALARDPRAALAEVAASLRHSDRAQRILALETISWFGEEASGLVPAVAGSRLDPDPSVRARALETLGRIGAGSAAACREGVASTGDPDPAVRQAALDALASIGPVCEAVPALVSVLRRGATRERVLAARAFAKVHGAASRAAVPDLARALEGPAPLAAAGARALGRIGPDAAVAFERLVELARSDRPEVRAEALHAIAAIRPDDPGARAALREALDAPEARVRRVAARAWIRHAVGGGDTAELRRLADHSDPRIAARAGVALVAVARPGAGAPVGGVW